MNWLREPLVHFLALGVGLFLLFALVGGRDGERTDRIMISAAQVELLAEGFAKTWQRPPTFQELVGLVDDHVRDEVYYREAIAMGLDRHDTIIRRRMRQKLEFLTEDVMAAADPTVEELEVYLADHSEQFRIPASLSFDHVYLNPDSRGDATTGDAERIVSRLRGESGPIDWQRLGDPILLPAAFDSVSEIEIERQFGAGFAVNVLALPVGQWSGPIKSGYGLHVVRVRERSERQIPPLEVAREAVEREWRAVQRDDAAEAFYAGLRERYEVEVGWPEWVPEDVLGGEEGKE